MAGIGSSRAFPSRGDRAVVRPAEARAAAWLLAPGLGLLLLFFLLPILASLLLSFTDFDIYAVADPGNTRFVWLRNYSRLLADPIFWKALGNTFFFVVLGVPLTVAVSLGSALLVNARLVRFRGLFRTIYFVPVVTSMVAVATVWRYLYHPRFGLINAALAFLGVPAIDWLGDPRWAMPAIVLMAVWKNFGFNMIIFVAGLQAIPESLYEAARIDGANAWQRFRYVTLPMLGPTFFFVGVMTMIGYFQLFAEPYVMTRGGPLNATLSIALLMYREGFTWWNLGYSAAVAFVLFLIIGLVSILQWAAKRERGA